MRFAIIADDLTGASDCAGQFGGRGWRAAVTFDLERPEASDVEALAIDTESRHLHAPAAADRALRAATAVRPAPVVMKKIDSTLRGPLAAEIAAALTGSGRARAVVAPAFPAYGRTTAGGVQLVHGTPVAETVFGLDPLAPATESDLTALLTDLAGVPPVIVPRAALRRGQEAWRLMCRARVSVIDVEQEADLDELVKLVPDHGDVLWCGSTGLARALGRAYARPRAAPLPSARAGRVLVVVGSVNPEARRQLDALIADDRTAVVPLAVASGAAADPRAACLVLHGPPPGALPAGDAEGALRIARELATAAAHLVEGGGIDGLVVTGGETAIAVIRALDGHGIVLDGEVEAGIPVGRIAGQRPLRIVTKAGGFGSPRALVSALDALTDAARVPV